jgi:hypothetical protein
MDTNQKTFENDPYEDEAFLEAEAERASFFAIFERTGTYPI